MIDTSNLLENILSRKITDKRVLKLIRQYLTSGIMINGIKTSNTEGTPQGGPLSPLLSNIMLDEVDKELEKRGHKFCRFADDANIYVKSKKTGKRVMESMRRLLEDKLKLKVNQEKSKVGLVTRRRFLGFSFYFTRGGVSIRIHPDSYERFKEKIRVITNRNTGISMEIMLRACIWKQWKKIRTKHNNLIKLGISEGKAWEYANTRKGYWRTTSSPILSRTLTNAYLEKLGYKSISKRYQLIH